MTQPVQILDEQCAGVIMTLCKCKFVFTPAALARSYAGLRRTVKSKSMLGILLLARLSIAIAQPGDLRDSRAAILHPYRQHPSPLNFIQRPV